MASLLSGVPPAGPPRRRGARLKPPSVSGGLLAPLLVQVQDLTHVGPVALFAEAVRQAFFGLILGLAYPVLRARHRSNSALEPLGARPSTARQAQAA